MSQPTLEAELSDVCREEIAAAAAKTLEVSKPRIEKLSPQEQKFLRDLEARNQQLTCVVGNKCMEFDQAVAALRAHRQALIDGYVSVLKVHGIERGNIDTAAGFIERSE